MTIKRFKIPLWGGVAAPAAGVGFSPLFPYNHTKSRASWQYFYKTNQKSVDF
jgi:hypothetical protein